MIKDFTDDYSLHGEKFLVVNAIVCKSAKGGKYLNIKVQDSSDVIEAKKWNANDDDETILRRGNIVRIHGVVSIYNKNLQLNIESAEICDSANLDDYIVSSPLSEKYLRDEVARLMDLMQDEELKLVLGEFLHKYDKQYFIYPSA
ncbi:MAG: OB-fold nucleic acid binding domain-containing protein, partial [Bacilli bacterium]